MVSCYCSHSLNSNLWDRLSASSTTFNNATQVTAVAPKSSFLNAQEPYTIKFTASTGTAGSSASGLINVDSAPTFGVASGTLGTLPNANRSASGLTTVTATDAEGQTAVRAFSMSFVFEMSGSGGFN